MLKYPKKVDEFSVLELLKINVLNNWKKPSQVNNLRLGVAVSLRVGKWLVIHLESLLLTVSHAVIACSPFDYSL